MSEDLDYIKQEGAQTTLSGVQMVKRYGPDPDKWPQGHWRNLLDRAAQALAPPPPPPPPPPVTGALFAGGINKPIPSNPVVELGYGQGAFALYKVFGMGGPGWGHAIFDARGKNWPKRTVTNGTWTMENVPLPPNVWDWWNCEPSSGYYERHMSVLTDEHVFNIYGSSGFDATTWKCRAMACLRAPGESHGWWRNDLGPYLGCVSGACDAVGTVTKKEFNSGVIPHAGVLLGGAINNSSNPRQPATAGDGKGGTYDKSKNLQVGSLLQLDPTLDVNVIGTKWAPIVKMLQTYGGYIVDSSTDNIFKIIVEGANENGVVRIDDGTFGNVAGKLIPHLRLIGLPSVPCTTANGLVYDDHTVYNQPHK